MTNQEYICSILRQLEWYGQIVYDFEDYVKAFSVDGLMSNLLKSFKAFLKELKLTKSCKVDKVGDSYLFTWTGVRANPNKILCRDLSDSEKKVIALLKKIDKLASNSDFNASIFGHTGNAALLILHNAPDEINRAEFDYDVISRKTVAWEGINLRADGGDPNFID